VVVANCWALHRSEAPADNRGHAETDNGHRKTRAASAPNAGDRESTPPPERTRHGKRPPGSFSFFCFMRFVVFEPRFQKIIILFASLSPLRLCSRVPADNRGHAETDNEHRQPRRSSAPNSRNHEIMPPPKQTQHGKRPPVGSWGYAAPVRLAFFFFSIRAVFQEPAGSNIQKFVGRVISRPN